MQIRTDKTTIQTFKSCNNSFQDIGQYTDNPFPDLLSLELVVLLSLVCFFLVFLLEFGSEMRNLIKQNMKMQD